jgi:predicted O-methyltransferase YrrM
LALSVLDGYVRRQHLASDIVEYLPLLYGYARVYENVRVQEIGTRDGNSTLAFLAAAEAVGGHVWSVDIDRDVPDKPNGMLAWKHCEHWTFTAGDSTSPGVINCQPAQVDVLFIDSGHEFDLTVRELRAYIPRVVPGGTVLLHDTRLHYDNYGVKRALDAYCAETGRIWHDLPGQYGLGLIHIA